MTNRTNQPKVDTFIVASGNQAFPTGGDPLVPATGNAMGVANGQIAVVDADTGLFLTAGDTAADSPRIKIVQGTPNSADISGLDGNSAAYSDKPYVSSYVIDSNFAITATAKAQSVQTRSAFLLGDTAANAGSITPLDLTQYKMNLTFDGRRQNKAYSSHGFDSTIAYYTTPDYTTLGTTNSLDHLVKNVAYQLNINSAAVDHIPVKYGARKPFIAFAVRVDTVAAGAGTALSALAAGTPFNFMVRNGQTLTYTPDAAFIATITEAIANSALAAGSTIEVIDLSDAGATANRAEAILLVALDESGRAVVEDREPTTRVRLRVGVANQFNGTSVSLVEASFPNEDEGTGRYWNLEYKLNAKHNVWSQEWVGLSNQLIVPPNYIDETQEYNAFIIEHHNVKPEVNDFTYTNMQRIIILVPATAGASEANTLGSLNSTLAVWLRSASKLEKVITPATAPAIFV